MSTAEPQFEKPDRLSLLWVDPTVRAYGAPAGDEVAASRLALPAATTDSMLRL